MRSAILLVAVLATACRGSQSAGPLATLRSACEPAYFFDGGACKPRGDAAKQIAASKQALVEQAPDQAKTALDAAEQSGPLDYASNVTLWEQRGIASAFLEDDKGAAQAFDMMLALDASHILSYKLNPNVTLIFERVREASKKTELDVRWPTGLKTGDPVPLDVEVVADPKQLLRRATVFVRERGTPQWRAADLALTPRTARIAIPGVRATKPTSLELYLRAYDDRGNEVLAFADPTRPREIPLRYDPPPKWYRNWKTYAIGGTAAAVITGVIVYAVTLAPPDNATGTGVVR